MIFHGDGHTLSPLFTHFERTQKMRITLESDYALRIVTALALHNERVDAGTLAEETSVTQRFTLKILHKLVGGGIVTSYKGAKGGYQLQEAPENITLRRVIELIDGPIIIARCVESGESCALNADKTSCTYHHIFNRLSIDVARKLEGISIKDVLDKNYTLS